MMEIDIIASEDLSVEMPLDSGRLRTYAEDVLGRNGVADGEVNIVFIDDTFMAQLNESYRGRTGTTDVLSFNLTDAFTDGLNGEIYVSLPRARAQAEEIGVPFPEEVVRLVTHGLLHLAGYVHDTSEQYEAMTQKTEELVREYIPGGSAW